MNAHQTPPTPHTQRSASITRKMLEEARAERRAIDERAYTLRHELRERAAELTALERRLDVLNEVEEQLQAELVSRRNGLRSV
jgi:septal ring factor EnvC (AmiA/AmiB activator)